MLNLTEFSLIVRSNRTGEVYFQSHSKIGLAPMSIGDTFKLTDGTETEIVIIRHSMAQVGVDALEHSVEVLVDIPGK
jgi:hypothetical protein